MRGSFVEGCAVASEEATKVRVGAGTVCVYVVLDRLTTLSDVAAKALAQHQGVLSLVGLTAVSDITAEALEMHRGSRSLSGLAQFSVQTSLSLVAHRGTLHGSGRILKLSHMHQSDEQLAEPRKEKWFMSPDGILTQDDCSQPNADALSAFIAKCTASPQLDQLVVAHRLADRLCEVTGFTASTYGMHPWAPAYRCQMLASVVRWLVDLGDKARAEQVLREIVAWGFGQRAWQDVDWVIMAVSYWLGAYGKLFGTAAGSPLDFAREQGWWRGHLTTLEKEHGRSGYRS